MAENVAPLVKCFPHKHSSLSSIPKTHVKEQSVGVPTCNYSTGETEIGGFLWLATQCPRKTPFRKTQDKWLGKLNAQG